MTPLHYQIILAYLLQLDDQDFNTKSFFIFHLYNQKIIPMINVNFNDFNHRLFHALIYHNYLNKSALYSTMLLSEYNTLIKKYWFTHQPLHIIIDDLILLNLIMLK